MNKGCFDNIRVGDRLLGKSGMNYPVSSIFEYPDGARVIQYYSNGSKYLYIDDGWVKKIIKKQTSL